IVVHEAAQLRKAPTQRASRVVGDLPEQIAQMLAAEGPAVQRQVGQQRPCLFGRGQLDARAVAKDFEPPEELELERGHDAIVVPDLHSAKRSQPRDETLAASGGAPEIQRFGTEKPRSLPRPLPRSASRIVSNGTPLTERPMARFKNILDTIGNTPLVRLGRLAPAGVNVYVKIESF